MLLSRDRGPPSVLGGNTPRIIYDRVAAPCRARRSGVQAYRLRSPLRKVTGRRGKERAASLRAEQRLAAGGAQRSPDPDESKARKLVGSPDPYYVKTDPYLLHTKSRCDALVSPQTVIATWT